MMEEELGSNLLGNEKVESQRDESGGELGVEGIPPVLPHPHHLQESLYEESVILLPLPLYVLFVSLCV